MLCWRNYVKSGCAIAGFYCTLRYQRKDHFQIPLKTKAHGMPYPNDQTSLVRSEKVTEKDSHFLRYYYHQADRC